MSSATTWPVALPCQLWINMIILFGSRPKLTTPFSHNAIFVDQKILTVCENIKMKIFFLMRIGMFSTGV